MPFPLRTGRDAQKIRRFGAQKIRRFGASFTFG
jgi:hypothetical protein